MKTPFVKIFVRGKELSQFVESVRYDRSDEKDDYLNIRLQPQFGAILADSNDIVAGAYVEFQYGFLGGIPSPIHVVKISEIKLDYKFDKNNIAIELKCLDKGSTIKQSNDDKVWSGSSDEIAKGIADKYGMELDIQRDHAFKKYKSLPQGFKSDFQLLEYLARNEGFEVYVMSNVLVFKSADLGKKSKRLLTYGVNIISLSIEYKSVHKKRGAIAVMSSTIDRGSKNLKTVLQTKGLLLEQNSKFLDVYRDKYTLDGVRKKLDDIRSSPAKMNAAIKKEELFASKQREIAFKANLEREKQLKAAQILNSSLKANSGDKPKAWVETKKYLKETFGSDDAADYSTDSDGKSGTILRIYPIQKNHSQSADGGGGSNGMSNDQDKAKKKILTATIEIELDTSFQIGDIITLSGVIKKHSGNWYVHGIEDSISASRVATTRLTLGRSSSNGKTTVDGDKNDNVNNSVGEDEQKKNKGEVRFQFDSNRDYKYRYTEYKK